MASERARPHPRRLARERPAPVRPHHDILDMTVGEIMSRDLRTITTEAELWEARAQFEHHAINHLLVEDRGSVVAVLSDRDVLRAISPYADGISSQRRDEATLHRRVFQVATYHLVTVSERAPVQEAAAILLEHHISCLPVTDDDDQVVGIVTTRDLLRGMLECVVPRDA